MRPVTCDEIDKQSHVKRKLLAYWQLSEVLTRIQNDLISQAFPKRYNGAGIERLNNPSIGVT